MKTLKSVKRRKGVRAHPSVEREAGPPAAEDLPPPKYLGDRYVPLPTAIRWAQQELAACPTEDAFDRRLREVGAEVAPRLLAMLASKNESVAAQAIDAFVKLRRMGLEREEARLGFLGQAIDTAGMVEVGRLQAEVEKIGQEGIANPAMLEVEMTPRIRHLIREELAVHAQHAAGGAAASAS